MSKLDFVVINLNEKRMHFQKMQSSISNTWRGETTTWAQTAAIVEWLEAEGGRNFKFITGQLASEASEVVAGRKLTKQAAYGELADYVNEKFGTNWNSTKAEPRYCTLETKFKSAKRKFLDDSGAKYMYQVVLSQHWHHCHGNLASQIQTYIEIKLEVACE